ncbi:MAG: ZIP family metal transporter [Candidatus Aenigmatarchaeota archaeon]
MLEYILGSSVLISLFSLSGIITLSLKGQLLNKILLLLVALSAGALVGGAFFHLLPEAVEEMEGLTPFIIVVTGFMLFYIMERFLYWRHCHKDRCEYHMFRYLNLIGDGIHNFLDGMTIAVSYLTNVPLGIAATIAVASHEIPQEIGDFGVLVYGGFTKRKALLYNMISALTIVPGAIIGYLLSCYVAQYMAYILPLAAGGFLYIAATDLMPEIKKVESGRKSAVIFATFLLGVAFMLWTKLAFGG